LTKGKGKRKKIEPYEAIQWGGGRGYFSREKPELRVGGENELPSGGEGKNNETVNAREGEKLNTVATMFSKN